MRSATVLVCVIVAIAGCGAGHEAIDAPPDSEAPLVIPMQIVVTDGTVSAYMNAIDHGSCGCAALTFPSPGTRDARRRLRLADL